MSVAVDAELPQQSCQGGFTALSLTAAFIISFFLFLLRCCHAFYGRIKAQQQGREEDPLTLQMFNGLIEVVQLKCVSQQPCVFFALIIERANFS